MKNKVKEKRLQKGLTQESLAEACHVSRQTIISIENEKYDPSTKLALKIGRALKHHVEELFFLGDEK
jgi:putative transcriptional regulator